MCAQKLDRVAALYHFYHYGSIVEFQTLMLSNDLKQKFKVVDKFLLENVLIEVEQRLRKLTSKQLEILRTLVSLYQEDPKWYDKYAIALKMGKRKNYRITVGRMLAATQSKNLRGNRAFKALIETESYHSKKPRQSHHNTAFFRRQVIVFRPKGFLRRYAELYTKWKDAVDCVNSYFSFMLQKIDYDLKYTKENPPQPFTTKLDYSEQKQLFWQNLSDRFTEEEVEKITAEFVGDESASVDFPIKALTAVHNEAIKSMEAYRGSIESMRERFTKTQENVNNFTASNVLTMMYNGMLKPEMRTNFIPFVKSVTDNLAGYVDHVEKHLDDSNKKIKSECMGIIEQMIFFNPQLDELTRFVEFLRKYTQNREQSVDKQESAETQ